MTDPFAPIGIDRAPAKSPKRDVDCVMPVPDTCPPLPAEHPSLGRPAGRSAYNDAAGRLLGLISRFDRPGGKEFRPITLWRTRSDGRLAWRWESWPAPRPLYGLDRLAARPRARVIVTEGEKAADAVGRLLPQDVVVTSPNGAKSAAKVDWTPLRGRDVVVWPDADAAGAAYAEMVAKRAVEARVQSICIVDVPTGVMAGWDAADAEAEGWTTNDVQALINAARPMRRAEAEKFPEHHKPGRSAGSGGAGDQPAASSRRGPAKRDHSRA